MFIIWWFALLWIGNIYYKLFIFAIHPQFKFQNQKVESWVRSDRTNIQYPIDKFFLSHIKNKSFNIKYIRCMIPEELYIYEVQYFLCLFKY